MQYKCNSVPSKGRLGEPLHLLPWSLAYWALQNLILEMFLSESSSHVLWRYSERPLKYSGWQQLFETSPQPLSSGARLESREAILEVGPPPQLFQSPAVSETPLPFKYALLKPQILIYSLINLRDRARQCVWVLPSDGSFPKCLQGWEWGWEWSRESGAQSRSVMLVAGTQLLESLPLLSKVCCSRKLEEEARGGP